MKGKLSQDIIIAAVEGLEARKAKIDEQIAELRSMLKGASAEPSAVAHAVQGKRRNMSAATRAKMAAAQQRRWANRGQETRSEPNKVKAAKPKRKLSAAGRAAIVAALKKRWASKKAAKAA